MNSGKETNFSPSQTLLCWAAFLMKATIMQLTHSESSKGEKIPSVGHAIAWVIMYGFIYLLLPDWLAQLHCVWLAQAVVFIFIP